MSRDYKPSPERTKSASKGNPFFSGLLTGFLLGVGASLAVVMYIQKGDSPFTVQSEAKKPIAEKIAEDARKSAEPQSGNNGSDDKTRFDFYTILPGSESKVSSEELDIKDQQPVVAYAYYLQVGAFQSSEDADNMKAKLALQGFEAVVQTATIPDKGVWHRVRVGPLNSLDEINKARNDLTENGFKTDLIKVNNDSQ